MNSSFFPDGRIYVIVPTIDLTEGMVNCAKLCFNSAERTDFRTSNDGLQTLIKVKPGFTAVFNHLKWFNSKSILVELQKVEWVVNAI